MSQADKYLQDQGINSREVASKAGTALWNAGAAAANSLYTSMFGNNPGGNTPDDPNREQKK